MNGISREAFRSLVQIPSASAAASLLLFFFGILSDNKGIDELEADGWKHLTVGSGLCAPHPHGRASRSRPLGRRVPSKTNTQLLTSHRESRNVHKMQKRGRKSWENFY